MEMFQQYNNKIDFIICPLFHESISWNLHLNRLRTSLSLWGGECNGHCIFPVIKDISLYPTHDPPLYSEQQHCML